MVILNLAETTHLLPMDLNPSQGSPQESQASAEPESQLSQCLLLGLQTTMSQAASPTILPAHLCRLHSFLRKFAS